MVQDGTFGEYSRVAQDVDNRKIGYTLVEAAKESDRQTAIVYFYPLSGCSQLLEYFARPALLNYKCSVLCVDRPNCASTDELLPHPSSSNHNTTFDIRRIHGAAQDVMTILNLHGIHNVYLLGVCIGHPYAIQVARMLLQNKNASTNTEEDVFPKLKGITLVAPFVSIAAPTSWYVARLGASMPSCIVQGCVGLAAFVGPMLMPLFLRPAVLMKMLTQEEQCGWTDDDFKQTCAIVVEANKLSKRAKRIEVQLGMSAEWQAEICDLFARESGFGLQTEEEGYIPFTNDVVTTTTTNKLEDPSVVPPLVIPFRIFASADDKLATLESIRWIANRCYGGEKCIQVESNFHSHEVMTFFGGPPRNPILLHKIAREWGLV
jgi:pimeloyl-ACP methyl ester carboxylesterase